MEDSIKIRKIRSKDYAELAKIFSLCYGKLDSFWDKPQIEKLCRLFPKGQIVAEVDGCVVGCALSLITSSTVAASGSYSDVIANGSFDTHSDKGDILYCLEIFVHPDYRGCHVARTIYEYRKDLCRSLKLKGIVLGGRLPNYHIYADSYRIDEYLSKVKNGEIYDSVLTCQLNNGFKICGIKQDYFKFDTESEHYASLLKWTNDSFCDETKVAVIGAGNVGLAIAADLSIKGYDVTLIKTSSYNNVAYNRLKANGGKIWLKEKGVYTQTTINNVTKDINDVKNADVVFCTIQSGYYQMLVERLNNSLNEQQIFVCICSYASSYYFQSSCYPIPTIVEAIEPYLEGRVELEDKIGEVVFRVGYRQTECPASYISAKGECRLRDVFGGFVHKLSVLETALLNPNMVLHTVGSIMSLSRIEYSKGNFCMYREAYARGNEATTRIMLKLDKEKQKVLQMLGFNTPSVFEVAGFKKDEPLESFYRYSESSDRAISPTSIHSRYITEDVSQGLVLLESIGKRIGLMLPVTSSLINLASVALETDFRAVGRTVEKLGIGEYIDKLYERE